jgi:hypothetical protein
VTFSWVPATSGTATIATCDAVHTTYDTVVYLRSGACMTGPQLTCNDDTPGCATASGANHGSSITPTVVAGETYFIVVDGYGGRQGNFSLTVTAPVATPPGACDEPVVVPAAGGTFTGTTSGSSTLAATCAATDTAPETVFQWTPVTTGVAMIATCGVATTFDTVLSVRTGSCRGGTEVACNDDTAGCQTGEPSSWHASRISMPVTAGETYFIVVDGYAGRSGAFAITVTAP